MNEIELDLEQNRLELHQIRISGPEWEAIGPGLKDVYRQCCKRMRCALGQGDDEAFHKWRIRVKNKTRNSVHRLSKYSKFIGTIT
jgi:hypothetical protein